ncbi:chitobiase/beta-hexosaminidase C-terminal domain-containing protein [Eubacteriaceae bacterium ES3]|nr:chitobiase/beta-hexosaminidase C-terminal domain-containing protein [Eubacteriaceae bacterium ES3]
MNNQETNNVENDQTSKNSFNKEPKSNKKLILIISIICGLLLVALAGFFITNQLGLFKQSQNTSDSEDLKTLYNDLISSYVASEKSDAEIIELLEKAASETGDQNYINNQDSYLVKKPSFSLIPGTYEGSQTLTINQNNANATVTYTLDGSEPTSSSNTYSGPITLPIGTTTIKAVAISDIGILSAVAEGTYILTSTTNDTITGTTTTNPSALTDDQFINSLYGVWYEESSGNVLMISQTNFYDYIPEPLSVASGSFEVISTTNSGGTINVKDLTVDGYNSGDTLVNFDFGTPGDNIMRWQYDGKIWHEDSAAESLGGDQYRIPFTFAGSDIFTMN